MVSGYSAIDTCELKTTEFRIGGIRWFLINYVSLIGSFFDSLVLSSVVWMNYQVNAFLYRKSRQKVVEPTLEQQFFVYVYCFSHIVQMFEKIGMKV